MEDERVNNWIFAIKRDDETVDSYVCRFLSVAPSFPIEVIKMWMWRHGPQTIWEMLEIPPSAYQFHLVEISSDDLPRRDAFRQPAFYDMWTDETHVNARKKHAEVPELWDFMVENHTWPLAPLVVDTASSSTELTKHLHQPLHIVDGHTRIAMAHLLRSKGLLDARLPLWLCVIKST